jgi:SET domain-containing protein
MPQAGRGVFARVSIQKGECIEECPVIEIPEYDVASLSESILLTYIYFFGEKRERLVIVLGFGSIYNHADIPNAAYKENHKEMTVDFIASRDIKKDEEITVNYAPGKKRKNPLWFDVSS